MTATYSVPWHDSAVITFLGTNDVAARLGVKPATVRSWLARGQMPQPDCRIGSTPGWKAETIDDWDAKRPGADGTPVPPRKRAATP